MGKLDKLKELTLLYEFMDAEMRELRRKAELWEKVEGLDNTCDSCPFHIDYSCCQEGCPFAVVLYALTEKEPT